MSYRAAVITCSDRASAGQYEDRSGPIAAAGLTELGFDTGAVTVVPDDIAAISGAITDAIDAGARVVVTTGGTGISPRDVTVEATRIVIDYELPGLMEEVRRQGAANTPHALISRAVAGVASVPGRPRALVINSPGSTGGVKDTIRVIGPLLNHLVSQLDGGDH